MHAFATQMLQCWKGVDYRKKVIEVPECDPRDEEASGGFEYREKEWEAGMKRKVLKTPPSFRSGCLGVPIRRVANLSYEERLEPRELAVKDNRKVAKRTCCRFQDASNQHHFVDIVA